MLWAVFDRIRRIVLSGLTGGLEFCYKYNIVPHYILGDFDSISPKILSYYENQEIPVKRYRPEKGCHGHQDRSGTGPEAWLYRDHPSGGYRRKAGSLYGKSEIPVSPYGTGSTGMDPGQSECHYLIGSGEQRSQKTISLENMFLSSLWEIRWRE